MGRTVSQQANHSSKQNAQTFHLSQSLSCSKNQQCCYYFRQKTKIAIIIIIICRERIKVRVTLVSEFEAILISTIERMLWNLAVVSCFRAVMRIENGALIMQQDALKKPAVPCCRAVFMQSSPFHARTSNRSFFLLTDPMPESATESLPESVVCVFPFVSEPVFSVLPPTGQSILAVIWLVLAPVWADSVPFWLVPLIGGVTVMLGTGLSSRLTLLGVVGVDLDFGDSRAEEGLCGDPGEDTWSGPENLLIRFLTLPARCRFELRDSPAGGLLWPAPKACSASSLLAVWWRLSGDWEEEDSGACWKRWTQ